MKCMVTGAETSNKWRNLPICTDVIKLAKAMENEEGFKGCSQRERIIILKQRWDDRIKEEVSTSMSNKEYKDKTRVGQVLAAFRAVMA